MAYHIKVIGVLSISNFENPLRPKRARPQKSWNAIPLCPCPKIIRFSNIFFGGWG
jgi:hypothetical protein